MLISFHKEGELADLHRTFYAEYSYQDANVLETNGTETKNHNAALWTSS